MIEIVIMSLLAGIVIGFYMAFIIEGWIKKNTKNE